MNICTFAIGQGDIGHIVKCTISSPELKAQVNFSHFLLQNHWANFNQTWHNESLSTGKWNSSLFK